MFVFAVWQAAAISQPVSPRLTFLHCHPHFYVNLHTQIRNQLASKDTAMEYFDKNRRKSIQPIKVRINSITY